MTPRTNGFIAAAAALGLALAAAGCGGSAAAPKAAKAPPAAPTAAPTASSAKPLTHVTLRLGWLMAGYDGAFVAAQDQGYYKRAGLSVKIEEGHGSTGTAEQVAAGKDTFGFADDSTVARLISKGAPLRSVASLVQLSPAGMIHGPGVHLARPQDLKGRTILANAAGGPAVQLFEAVLRKGGLKKSDVHFDIVATSAEASSFKAHPQDILLGFGNSTYASVLKLDPQARFTPDSKFGVNALSSAIVTNLDELSRHPDVVRGFVAASIEGWRFMTAHPAETVREIRRAWPKTDQRMLTQSLQFTLPWAHTAATRGKPLGWAAASDWRATLDFLHRYGGMKTVRPLADYYTNRFVPSGS